MEKNDVFKKIRKWCYCKDVPKEEMLQDLKRVINAFIEVQEALLYGFKTTEDDGATASDVLEYLAVLEEIVIEEMKNDK